MYHTCRILFRENSKFRLFFSDFSHFYHLVFLQANYRLLSRYRLVEFEVFCEIEGFMLEGGLMW